MRKGPERLARLGRLIYDSKTDNAPTLRRMLAVATAIDWSTDSRCPAKWKIHGWTYRCSMDRDHPRECAEEAGIRRLARAFPGLLDLRARDDGPTHLATDKEGTVTALWSSMADYTEGEF